MDEHKIKVFASDDNLKELGELLSNDSSRKIFRAIMNNEMYKNEIATTLDIASNLVGHHLDKLEDLGLVEIKEKKLKRKHTTIHKYYKINSHLFITMNTSKAENEKSGLLKRIFKDGVKFASIGIASVFTWLSVNSYNEIRQIRDDIPLDPIISFDRTIYIQNKTNDLGITEFNNILLTPYLSIPIIIFGLSLFLFLFNRKYK